MRVAVAGPGARGCVQPGRIPAGCAAALLHIDDDALTIAGRRWDDLGLLNATAYVADVCAALASDVNDMQRRVAERQAIMDTLTRQAEGDGAFADGLPDFLSASAFQPGASAAAVMRTREQLAEHHRFVAMETQLASEFCIIATELFAALASGPLCADGRSCADHALSFMNREYAAHRTRDVASTLITALNARVEAFRELEPQVLAGAGLAELVGPDEEPPPFIIGYSPVELSLVAPSRSVQDAVTHVQRDPSPCAPWLLLETALAALAAVAADVDPFITQVRRLWYDERVEEQQRRQRALAERKMLPLDDVYGLGSVTAQSEEEFVPPAPQPPPIPEISAYLRLLLPLCADANTRKAVIGARIALPDAAVDAAKAVHGLRAMYRDRISRDRPADASLVDSDDALTPELRQWCAQVEKPDMLQAYSRSTRPPAHTTLVQVLLHILRLSTPIDIKAHILRILGMCARDTSTAARIRDDLEAYQILQTIPHAIAAQRRRAAPVVLGNGWSSGSVSGSIMGAALPAVPPDTGIQMELERVETAERTYDATIAFCEIFRILHGAVPMHTLGALQRVPGVHRHIDFIAGQVFVRCFTRAVRPDRPADAFKMAYTSLGVIFDVVRGYKVVYPPVKPAPVAARPPASSTLAVIMSPQSVAGRETRVEDITAGLPSTDFLSDDALPKVPSERGDVRGHRSPGFELMRILLSGSEVTMQVFKLITCDGAAVVGLEAEFDAYADNTSSASITQRAAAAGGVSGDSFPTVPLTDSQRAAHDEFARLKAAPYVEASTQGASTHEAAVEWKERCLMLALALCDAVLAKDVAFINAHRSAGMPGVLVPFAELMRREHVLPHVVAAVGYRNDVRIGVLATRVLQQVVTAAADILPSSVLISELLTPLRITGRGQLTVDDLVQRVGACLQDDGGRDIDEDDQDAELTRQRRNRLEVAAAALGVIDVGFLQTSVEEDAPTAPRSLDGTMSAVLSSRATVRIDLQRADLVKKPAERAEAAAIAALLATAPIDPRRVITTGRVQLPISTDHGPLTTSLFGWAAVDMSERGSLSALAERRAIVLETIRAAISATSSSSSGTTGASSAGVSSEWIPASTLAAATSLVPRGMTLGHLLLGVPLRAFSPAAIGSSSALVELQSVNGLRCVLSLLSSEAVAGRPAAAAACAAIVSSLLQDATLCLRALTTLEDALAMEQDAEPTGLFLCERLLGLEQLLRRLQRTKLQHASEIILDDADHQVYITAVVNAEAAVVEAARVLQLPSVVTNAIRRALALRHTVASLMEAAAVQARVTGSRPFETSVMLEAFLGSSAHASAIRASFLLRVLPLIVAAADDDAGGQAAVASQGVATSWARSTPMPASMAAAIAKHAPSEAATAMHTLAMSRAVMGKGQSAASVPSVDAGGVIGSNGLGTLLRIGGVEYQTYDLDALRVLLIAETASGPADVLGGTWASTVLNRTTGPINTSQSLFVDMAGDVPDAQRVAELEGAAAARLEDVRACLWWAQQHNAYGMQLQALQHGAASWAQLVTCFVDNVLPTAPATGTPDAATVLAMQDAQAGVLVTMLYEVVRVLEELAPPAVVALPLARVCEYLLVTLRTRCNAALPVAKQVEDIVRGLCSVAAALSQPPPVGTLNSMQPAATTARTCVYSALIHATHYVHAVPLVTSAAPGATATAPAASIEAAVSGWQAAMTAGGALLVDALVGDATAASAREASVALRTLSVVLMPTSNLLEYDAANRYGVGDIESAHRLASLPGAVVDAFAALRRDLIQHMIVQGAVHALVVTYINIDRVEQDVVGSLESSAIASTAADRGRNAQQYAGAPPSTPGTKRLGDSLQSVLDPGTGRKRVRLHNGSGVDTSRLEDSSSAADAELRSLVQDSDVSTLRDAYDAILSLFGCLSTDPLGSAALLDEGFVGALTRNRWLTRVVETTVGVRAIAAGASASALRGIATVPMGGEPGLTDGTVSYPLAVVAVIEPRVAQLLDLLTSMLAPRTADVALAAVVMTWTRTYYPLLDTIVQASLATPTSLGAVRLAAAFTRLLSVLASTPGGLEADSVDASTPLAVASTAMTATRSRVPVAAAASLGALRADALVTRLFMKFHTQPRAAPVVLPLVAAHGRRAGPLATASARPRTAWFDNIVPVTALERAAHAVALPSSSTLFEAHVADAAEALGCAMASYCRLRCTASLLSGRPVGDAAGAVALFLAPEDVAADALLSTSSPSISTLLDGLEEAALALEASRTAIHDARKLRAGDDPVGHARAHVLEVNAVRSGRACTFIVENLLTTWYAHALVHPRLRMSSVDTETILARAAFKPLFVGTGTGTDALFQPENQAFVASMRRQLLVVAADNDERILQ